MKIERQALHDDPNSRDDTASFGCSILNRMDMSSCVFNDHMDSSRH